MALTGIQIFKFLPKTNCKECGIPTCLAFAMNLASGKAKLENCPYLSEDARQTLTEASAPPIRAVAIGQGTRALTVGGETVLFRHEKTFLNKTGIAALIRSDISAADLEVKLKNWNSLQYERVGLNLHPELVVLKDTNSSIADFAGKAAIIAETSEFNLVLMTTNLNVMKAGIEASKFKKPLIYAATSDNMEEFGMLAKANDLPLAVKADSLEGLISLTTRLLEMGIKDLILDSGSRQIKQAFEDQILIRRAALKQASRALGFPTIAFPCEMTPSIEMETLIAGMFIAKYASIVVLSDFKGEYLFPLLLERLNIFTDPQRPMTVKEGIYEVGSPHEDSPVFVTTNFALTYFIVTAEIENSGIPAWLLIKDAEGLSVMTAWAAGKFSGDDVGIFVKKSGITDKIKHSRLIIPGYASAIVEELKGELPGWTIDVGPREAAHISGFLKTYYS